MAFSIETKLEGYEYRGVQTGVSQSTGKNWMSLVLESPTDARQVEVSVPENYQQTVRMLGLKKGQILDLPILAVSSAKYSFLRLIGAPVVLSAAGEDF